MIFNGSAQNKMMSRKFSPLAVLVVNAARRSRAAKSKRMASPNTSPTSIDLACPLNPRHSLHTCQYREYYRRVDNAL
ncbi:MAG: hypothetical protein ACI8W7_001030 [Gammaproteobacteria bacterium]|jgi:hypothetical protein